MPGQTARLEVRLGGWARLDQVSAVITYSVEIGMDDLRVFKSLCMEPERFQVATKMFAQRGKNNVAQESAAC